MKQMSCRQDRVAREIEIDKEEIILHPMDVGSIIILISYIYFETKIRPFIIRRLRHMFS